MTKIGIEKRKVGKCNRKEKKNKINEKKGANMKLFTMKKKTQHNCVPH